MILACLHPPFVLSAPFRGEYPHLFVLYYSDFVISPSVSISVHPWLNFSPFRVFRVFRGLISLSDLVIR